MIKQIEDIELQTILELLSCEMLEEDERVQNWGKGVPLRMPSLHDRVGYVYKMFNKASFNGCLIRFDADRNTVKTIPPFNYLLVTSEYILSEFINGASIPESVQWEIRGFDTFDRLCGYVKQAEFSNRFSVYIKHYHRYEKSFLRFAFQRPNQAKTYTNEWGFYCTNADFDGIWMQEPDYTYFFEIVGLCELCDKYGVFCSLENSLDDVYNELALRWSALYNQQQVFEETGTALWSSNSYTYRIWNNEKHGGWSLYDCDNNSYCPARHEFLPEIVCDMMVNDCEKCWEIVKTL